MHAYPHRYVASAIGRAAGPVTISSPGLPRVETAPPLEFDGPGGFWSPETLLTAAVANCFVLTFRAVARAGHFDWIALDCRAEGTLERIEGRSLFTRFATTVRLTVPPTADSAQARRLLERTEQGCLIANSLRAEGTLSIEVTTQE